ncbi:putative MFS-type transporter YfcJ [Emticicia aquatica]|uniref:MFS-type transporter YfcJ n=1 Tax=Emticicia aquatica TaxID=1681835 RepID=A0ABM9AM38_9BACT|nr:MFS transporter [Emticicia aquatica]CAH0994848.1 putative MFS-type transporter YfcJ [Emticicia aquatica]
MEVNKTNTQNISVILGLKENWQQFGLLVILNAFVGGMVGLERSIIPQLAETEFGLSSKSAILSFIIAFGITKAIANYFTGRLANKIGRKNLLIIGWLLALPIPIIIIYANSWSWIIVANMLLGISQGLTWSSTVVMKMDLVGEKQRGLAMGINEFAGYLAIGIVAFLTGYIAEKYGVRPYPFYIGIVISILGLLLSIIWVKDTKKFVLKETKNSRITTSENVFMTTTFSDKTLSSVTQAGLINNLNDGMIWGFLPILLLQLKLNNQDIGIITAIYPTFWGIGQLFTGKMSDIYSKKKMLFWGMLVQGIAIVLLVFAKNFYVLTILSAFLGIGTALVYPTFLSTIATFTNPNQRAESIGIFRLWRDLGYAFGAIISGIIADIFGMQYAVILIGIITIISAIVIQTRMPKTI